MGRNVAETPDSEKSLFLNGIRSDSKEFFRPGVKKQQIMQLKGLPMYFRILAALFLFLPVSAAIACRYKTVSLDDSLAQASVAFIGDVVSIEDGIARFRAEKGIKGIGDGEYFAVRMPAHSCGIRFQAGQRWLYLGEILPSGSRLLRDEQGRLVPGNLRAVAEKLGTP
jgi:hypothetical protein